MKITVNQAGVRLGVTPARIRQLIGEKRLKAVKVGRDWFLTEREVDQFKRRPAGRPSREGNNP